MISFEFIKTVESYIKKYDNFQLPVLICDKSLEVYWKNEKSKSIEALSTSSRKLSEILSELDVDEVLEVLARKGSYIVANIIPLFSARACFFPIVDSENQIIAMEIILIESGDQLNGSADFVSKTSDKLLQQLNSSIDDIFRANDALVRNANLLESRWTAPYLSIINAESYKLLRISNNLDAYTKLQNNLANPDLEIVDICQWFESVKPVIVELTSNEKIEVEFQLPAVPVYVPLDMKWFQIGFFNLVHNSVYHSTKQNKIFISVEESEDIVEIVIKDQGDGIDPELLDKVKKPYFSTLQGHLAPATGLGLTIADRATKALGGNLEITSAKGEGTQVTLKLPSDILRHKTKLRQSEKPDDLRNKFSQVYIGLTTAISSSYLTT